MFILDPCNLRFWYSDSLGNTELCNLDPSVVRRVLVQIELLLLLLLLLCTPMYSISAFWSIPLALSDGFLYVTYTTVCPLGGPQSPVIRTTPPHTVRMIQRLPINRLHKEYTFIDGDRLCFDQRLSRRENMRKLSTV